MSNLAFGITMFPFSWAWGYWDKGHKKLFAVGPIRFVYHPNVRGTYGESDARS